MEVGLPLLVVKEKVHNSGPFSGDRSIMYGGTGYVTAQTLKGLWLQTLKLCTLFKGKKEKGLLALL